MMRIILLSEKAEDKTFFEAVAALAKLPFVSAGTPESLCAAIQQDPEALIVVDVSTEQIYKKFETVVAEKVGLYSDTINVNRMFFVAGEDLQTLNYVAESDLFGHLIIRPGSREESTQPNQRTLLEDQQRTARLFSVAAGERAFGVERYFGPNLKVQEIVVTKASQKKSIVESLKMKLSEVGFHSRAATSIATAADEIIMNAIFDAPTDDTGRVMYAQTARSTEMELSERARVTFKIIFDGAVLGLAVSDQYGSLDKKKLLGHLAKSYLNDQFKVKASSAGAGLGMANVFNTCGGMVFCCEMGAQTEVMLFYRKAKSYKEFKDQFRFLSTFMYL